MNPETASHFFLGALASPFGQGEWPEQAVRLTSNFSQAYRGGHVHRNVILERRAHERGGEREIVYDNGRPRF